jgi:hypothetical protein
MVRSLLACLVLVSGATLAVAQQPFLSSEQWVKLRDEASGAAPYENLRYLTRLHRVGGSGSAAQPPQRVDTVLQNVGLRPLVAFDKRSRHCVLRDTARGHEGEA